MSPVGTKPTLGEHRIYVGLPPKVEVQATRVVTQIDRIADEYGDVRFQGQSRRSKRKLTLSRSPALRRQANTKKPNLPVRFK
jgi:hypothetical protein